MAAAAEAEAEAEAEADRLISNLPEEIHAEILLKLPVKSILSCKCVCKLWFNLISSPKFINDHLNLSIQNKYDRNLMFIDAESDTGKPLILYSIDYPSISSSSPDLSFEYVGEKAVLMDTPFEYKKGMKIRIVGTCNGLICFVILIDVKSSICIWNPTTRYKELQQCDFYTNPKHHSRDGFGYDSKTGDYKMVRIVDYQKSDYCKVEVYTFGLHLSKTVHTFPYKFPTHVAFDGVFLNGALHWISNICKKDIPNDIVSFDISTEKLMDVPLPEKIIIHPEDGNTVFFKKVGVLGDCLSLVLVDKLYRTVVWVMQDYGVRESWTKLTTSQKPISSYPYMPLMLLKNGEILMDTPDSFVLCDPKTGKVGKVSSFFQKNRIDAMRVTIPVGYIESLVSLNSGT